MNTHITALITITCSTDDAYNKALEHVQDNPNASEVVLNAITRTITYVLNQDVSL